MKALATALLVAATLAGEAGVAAVRHVDPDHPGLYPAHSADSVVAHNLVPRDALEGIAIIDEGRSPNRPELRPRRQTLAAAFAARQPKPDWPVDPQPDAPGPRR